MSPIALILAAALTAPTPMPSGAMQGHSMQSHHSMKSSSMKSHNSMKSNSMKNSHSMKSSHPMATSKP